MSLMQRGFTRLLHEGKQIDLASPDDYKLDHFENVYVLVDRLAAREDIRQRLVDSLETCFREGHGQAMIDSVRRYARLRRAPESGPEARVPTSASRKVSNASTTASRYATPEPRLFSFNNPFGACPTCQGFGNTIGLDLDLVIPNPGLTLAEGAIEPWTKPQYEWSTKELRQLL